jgi:hypothetical protein
MSGGFRGRQLFAQQPGQTANGGDVGGRDAYSRFGLDAGAQFEGAQRVNAVLGERTVGIDAATQAIERDRLALVDPEELGIEAGKVIEERAPLRHRPTRHPGLGVVVFVGVSAVGRNFGDQVIAAQQRLP